MKHVAYFSDSDMITDTEMLYHSFVQGSVKGNDASEI